MRILGFDTSTPSTAVGLMLEDGSVLSAYDHPDAGARPGHQTRLLPLASELLDRGGLDWRAIDRVAVGLGPGTYTGLRVGVASARSLAQSLGAQIVGVSSAQALAHAALRAPANESGEERADPPRAVITVVDARRGEVFVGAYAASGAQSQPATISAPRPVRVKDAAAEFARIAGEQVSAAWLGVGDAALSLREELAGAGVHAAPAGSALHDVDARALCELAREGEPQPLEAVVPEYCREADAELALAGAR